MDARLQDTFRPFNRSDCRPELRIYAGGTRKAAFPGVQQVAPDRNQVRIRFPGGAVAERVETLNNGADVRL
jgi:hypothetical protein